MYQVQVNKIADDYVTEVLDEGKVIASISMDVPATDDMIKKAILSRSGNDKELELEE
jgi:hypothetical protein